MQMYMILNFFVLTIYCYINTFFSFFAVKWGDILFNCNENCVRGQTNLNGPKNRRSRHLCIMDDCTQQVVWIQEFVLCNLTAFWSFRVWKYQKYDKLVLSV